MYNFHLYSSTRRVVPVFSHLSLLTSYLYCISTLNLAKMALPGFCSL